MESWGMDIMGWSVWHTKKNSLSSDASRNESMKKVSYMKTAVCLSYDVCNSFKYIGEETVLR